MNATPGSLWEWLAALDPDKRFVLSIVGLVFLFVAIVIVVSVVGQVVRGIHHARLESGLKRELLDRGLAADEIARIVEASSGGTATSGKLKKEV
jgi:hypothetical protein